VNVVSPFLQLSQFLEQLIFVQIKVEAVFNGHRNAPGWSPALRSRQSNKGGSF